MQANLLRERILKTICESQDNNPRKQIDTCMSDAVDCKGHRHATDNLNQLLADAIAEATASGDIEKLRDDLRYCATELRKASDVIAFEFFK